MVNKPLKLLLNFLKGIKLTKTLHLTVNAAFNNCFFAIYKNNNETNSIITYVKYFNFINQNMSFLAKIMYLVKYWIYVGVGARIYDYILIKFFNSSQIPKKSTIKKNFFNRFYSQLFYLTQYYFSLVYHIPLKQQQRKRSALFFSSIHFLTFSLRNFQRIHSKLTTYYVVLNLYNFFKKVLLSICLSSLFFTYFLYFFQIQFLKQLAIWFIIGNIALWLFSGFNFFLKRYKFGKFTSAIQRFWKRTNMIFWLIEGFLFLLFFYYYLNSSQEPTFFYDFNGTNQLNLFNLTNGFIALIYISCICYLLYYLLLNLAHFNITQIFFVLGGASVLIFFLFFLESYQFYYVLTSFTEFLIVKPLDFNGWCVEFDSTKFKTKHYFFMLCLIAKYWHFLFIFLSWLFFIIKSFELKSITYNLLAVNCQNFLLLYILNLCCYSQYFLFVMRRFYDLPYFWFFTNTDVLNWNFGFNLIINLFCTLFCIEHLEFSFFSINNVEYYTQYFYTNNDFFTLL